MRIYHESFQRFIRAKLENNEAHVADVLRPVVVWLESKEFLQDSRAFRFLIPLLVQSGRGNEVLERIGITFVADSVAHGHSGAAVLSNLTVAANVASELRDWPALVRVAQLSLASRTCYEEKLTDDLAYLYGRTFAEIHCPQDLADRLLFDGRTTFSPRTGLLLCALLDEAGIAAPWPEYRSAYKIQREMSNTDYGSASDTAVELAHFRGWLRLRPQTGVLDDLIDLATQVESDVLPGVVSISGDVGGIDLLRALADHLPPGEAKALCHLELARHEAAIDNIQEAADEAQAALGEGIPLRLAKDCVALGANPRAIDMTRERLVTATLAAADERAQHHSESVSQWVSLVKVAALVQPTLLLWVEAEIGGEGWYRAWLRFVVDLARVQSESGDTLPPLVELAKDTDPFKGQPRACDLYGLSDLIQETLGEALGNVKDEQWPAALEALLSISSGTTVWLAAMANGPLTKEALIELLCKRAITRNQVEAALELMARLVGDSNQSAEFYETHAGHELSFAHLQYTAGDVDSARISWGRALKYLAGYGWRRDRTIFELLDPIPAIGVQDSSIAREMLAELQPLVSAVLDHTDGKDTRHAELQWSRALVEVDPAGAAALFARRLAVHGGRIDDTVEGALPVLLSQACAHDAEPALIAGLWLSTRPVELDTILRVFERLSARNPALAREVWPLLVAAIEGDRSVFPAGLNAKLSALASMQDIDAPTLDVTTLLRLESTGQVDSDHARSTAPNYEAVFDTDATPLRIVRGLKAWRKTDPDLLCVDQLANALGWRLVQLADDDRATAFSLLRHAASDIRYLGRHELLGELGEGLARHGQADLAAHAYVLAFTRSRGGSGWLAFGGPECHEWLVQALQLNEEIALATLAAEVAELAVGDSWGMTGHLIECFSAVGRGAEGS